MSILLRRAWGRDKPPLGSQVDWGHPRSQGLVGCWLFNEGGGLSILDSTNVRPMTANGSFTQEVGDYGTASSFDGSTSYYSTSNVPVLSSDTFSISVICKQVSNASAVLASIGDSGFFSDWFIGVDKVAQGSANSTSYTIPQAGLYHHIVAIFSSSYINIFVDGFTTVGFPFSTAPSTPTFNAFRLGKLTGAWPGGPAVFGGQMAYAAVHKRALTPGEILDAFVNPFAHIWRPGVRRWFVGTGAAPPAGGPFPHFTRRANEMTGGMIGMGM